MPERGAMDKIKVAKVGNVLLQSGRRCKRGTLHLTQHHLIFVPTLEDVKGEAGLSDAGKEDSKREDAEDDGAESSKSITETNSKAASKASEQQPRDKETWIAYSLLWLVTRLASVTPIDASMPLSRTAKSARRIYPLATFTRNFESSTFGFENEAAVTDVFDSMRASVVAENQQSLYAFSHEPQPPLKLSPAGWSIYDFRAEFARQGIGSRTRAWRICELNKSYELARTYPARFCVPARLSDSTVRYATRYRSKERIPALTYLHWGNLATITRSSQPLVGFNNRSMQDEKLVEGVFTSHLFADPTSPAARAAMAASDELVLNGNATMDRSNVISIYGAQTTNLIIDARPTTNAMANRAKGAGTENMEHYKGCKKVYLGIDNIHVMRDSLQRVADALRTARRPATFGMEAVAMEEISGEANSRLSLIKAQDGARLDHQALKRSGWLKHISAILEGTLIITRNVHINNSHVLVHCSDGWDRTSQLAALAQLCLDPYYRTMNGFAVLVEKDWVSFGHRFWDRCGHASSERYFTTATDYGQEESDSDEGDEVNTPNASQTTVAFDSQAAANAFWGFTKQITANFQGSGDGPTSKHGAHLKEISPVFHQFLDCVWQLMRQFPLRFEFNECWLLDLYDAVFECKYGTFLYNNEADRNGNGQDHRTAPASSKTYSAWDALLDEGSRDKYLNKSFDVSLDKDTKRKDADMGVLLVNSKDVGFWGGLFRWDQEDINSLVKAEAEERKRQKETAERLRKAAEDGTGRATPAEVGPAEVEGVTIGPSVSGGQTDPILHATATVGRAESTALPYRPRVRASNTAHQASVSSPSKTFSSVNPLAPSNISSGQSDESLGAGAQFAANRMRNMVLGWGTRLQDAYASATAPGEESSSSRGASPSRVPRVAEADYGHRKHEAQMTRPSDFTASTQKSTAVFAPPEGAHDHSNAGSSMRNGSANPWASTIAPEVGTRIRSANHKVDGLPDTLGSDDPWQNATASTMARQAHARDESPKQQEEEQQGKQREGYDPLGVGLT